MLSLEPFQGSHHYYINIASPTLVYLLKRCSEQNFPGVLALATTWSAQLQSGLPADTIAVGFEQCELDLLIFFAEVVLIEEI